MKILKIPRLPKLKTVKYKCKHCGSTFLVNDKDVSDDNIYFSCINCHCYVSCPGCGMSVTISTHQYNRANKYRHILTAQRKWYGPQEGEDND